MPRLATIKVKADHKRGYKIINASTFDPDVHEPFEPPAPKAPAAPAPASETAVEHVYTDEQIAALTWPQLRSAAAKVSDNKIETKDDAIEALKAHREANAPAPVADD